jgi:hypothetical protein
MFLFRKALLLLLAMLVMTPAIAQGQECLDYVDDMPQMRLANGKFTPIERVTSYIAVIGERDLRNSSGTRLTDYRAVLQQDRANVHRTGKVDWFDDVEEDVDTYFTTLSRRKLLSTGPYYFDCWMQPDTITGIQNDIQSGQIAGVLAVNVIRLSDGSLAVWVSVVG